MTDLPANVANKTPSMKIKRNTCRRCGTCCRELFLEITGVDLLREPRWRPYIERYRDVDYRNWRAGPWEILFKVTGPSCPFLVNNQCSIYPTRPDMCVTFRALQDERCAANPNYGFEYGRVI